MGVMSHLGVDLCSLSALVIVGAGFTTGESTEADHTPQGSTDTAIQQDSQADPMQESDSPAKLTLVQESDNQTNLQPIPEASKGSRASPPAFATYAKG